MPTQLLSVGYTQAILQNIVYALPSGRVVRVQADAAVEVSNLVAFSPNDALTNADTVGAETSARFLRCTTGNTSVTVVPV
jgi:hypothetical protein